MGAGAAYGRPPPRVPYYQEGYPPSQPSQPATSFGSPPPPGTVVGGGTPIPGGPGDPGMAARAPYSDHGPASRPPAAAQTHVAVPQPKEESRDLLDLPDSDDEECGV